MCKVGGGVKMKSSASASVSELVSESTSASEEEEKSKEIRKLKELAELIRNIKSENLDGALLQGRFDHFLREDLEAQSSSWFWIIVNPDNLQNVLLAGLWGAFTTSTGKADILTAGLIAGTYPLQLILFSLLVAFSVADLGFKIHQRITKGKDSGVTNLDLAVSTSITFVTAASIAIGFMLLFGVGIAISPILGLLSSALFAAAGVIYALYSTYKWRQAVAKKNKLKEGSVHYLEEREAAQFGMTSAAKAMILKGLVAAVISALVFGVSVTGVGLLVASTVGAVIAVSTMSYYLYKKKHEKEKVKKIKKYLAARELLNFDKNKEDGNKELFNLATDHGRDLKTLFRVAINQSFRNNEGMLDFGCVIKKINEEEPTQKLSELISKYTDTHSVLQALKLYQSQKGAAAYGDGQGPIIMGYLRQYTNIFELISGIKNTEKRAIFFEKGFEKDKFERQGIVQYATKCDEDYSLLFEIAAAQGMLKEILRLVVKVKINSKILDSLEGNPLDSTLNAQVSSQEELENKLKVFFKKHPDAFKDRRGRNLKNAMTLVTSQLFSELQKKNQQKKRVASSSSSNDDDDKKYESDSDDSDDSDDIDISSQINLNDNNNYDANYVTNRNRIVEEDPEDPTNNNQNLGNNGTGDKGNPTSSEEKEKKIPTPRTSPQQQPRVFSLSPQLSSNQESGRQDQVVPAVVTGPTG